ncbi:hypothetical protein [Microcystis phage Mel-JY01]
MNGAIISILKTNKNLASSFVESAFNSSISESDLISIFVELFDNGINVQFAVKSALKPFLFIAYVKGYKRVFNYLLNRGASPIYDVNTAHSKCILFLKPEPHISIDSDKWEDLYQMSRTALKWIKENQSEYLTQENLNNIIYLQEDPRIIDEVISLGGILDAIYITDRVARHSSWPDNELVYGTQNVIINNKFSEKIICDLIDVYHKGGVDFSRTTLLATVKNEAIHRKLLQYGALLKWERILLGIEIDIPKMYANNFGLSIRDSRQYFKNLLR